MESYYAWPPPWVLTVRFNFVWLRFSACNELLIRSRWTRRASQTFFLDFLRIENLGPFSSIDLERYPKLNGIKSRSFACKTSRLLSTILSKVVLKFVKPVFQKKMVFKNEKKWPPKPNLVKKCQLVCAIDFFTQYSSELIRPMIALAPLDPWDLIRRQFTFRLQYRRFFKIFVDFLKTVVPDSDDILSWV
jgi:hypothetical protein